MFFTVTEAAILAQHGGNTLTESIGSAFDAVFPAVAEAAPVTQPGGNAFAERVGSALDAVVAAAAESAAGAKLGDMTASLSSRCCKYKKCKTHQKLFTHDLFLLKNEYVIQSENLINFNTAEITKFDTYAHSMLIFDGVEQIL